MLKLLQAQMFDLHSSAKFLRLRLPVDWNSRHSWNKGLGLTLNCHTEEEVRRRRREAHRLKATPAAH